MGLSWSDIGRRAPDLLIQTILVSQAMRALEQSEFTDFVARGVRGIEDLVGDVAPGGRVLGVGVAFDEEDQLLPTVFIEQESSEWANLERRPLTLSIGDRNVTEDSPVSFVGLPRARIAAGPGERCTGILNGTFGARVTDASGDPGLLTAGHVVAATGQDVYDSSGAKVGVVTECRDTAQLPPLVPGPDVALVKLDPGVTPSGSPHASQAGTAQPRSDLRVEGAVSGTSTTWVRGISMWWAGPDPTTGDWGYVLITRDGVTDGGDSGGPVFLDGTDELVGHVVGGSPGVYSLVQEVDYQLGIQPSPAPMNQGLAGVHLR